MTTKPELTCTQTDDAAVWAKEFCEINPSRDEGTMIGWFANAIECSSDIRKRRWDDIAAAREQEIRQDADHRIVKALRFLDCQKTWNGQGYTWNPVNPEMLIRMLSSVIGSDDCDKLQKERELSIIRATLEAVQETLDLALYMNRLVIADLIDPATILNNME